MLSVTKNNISYISYTKSVYQNLSCVYIVYYFCFLLTDFQNITGFQDENIIFRNAKHSGNSRICFEVTVFSVNRDRIFRFYQRIDQFQFFLTCMTGYMCILEDDIRSLSCQFIDYLGYRLFISRDRIRAEDDRITRHDRYFLMHICCHTRQSCHRFSLASGCDQNGLLRRIILKLVDLDQCLIRNIEISQFLCNLDDVHHASSLYDHLTVIFTCRIDDLLHTVYI